jgi:hypothetical protein
MERRVYSLDEIESELIFDREFLTPDDTIPASARTSELQPFSLLKLSEALQMLTTAFAVQENLEEKAKAKYEHQLTQLQLVSGLELEHLERYVQRWLKQGYYLENLYTYYLLHGNFPAWVRNSS